MSSDKRKWMPGLKTFVIILLMVICAGVTYYFHFMRHSEVIYTHLFYIPIALAGVWWGRGGIFVSVFLALDLLVSHLVSGVSFALLQDVLRGGMFIVVGFVLGTAVEERNRLQVEILEEKNGKIHQMEKYAHYMNRIAHELRNPLQVCLGVLDSIDAEKLTEEQQNLIDLLDKKAMEMKQKIKEFSNEQKG